MVDEPSKPPALRKNPLLELYAKNRIASALLATAALTIVPVLGLVASAREGWDAWATPAAVLGLAALLPALGILLGRSWGLAAAGYVSWFGIVAVVLRAMTLGFTPLQAAPALVYAAVLASLSSLAPPKPPPENKDSPPDLPLAVWAKENVEAIVVAFIMALVIRCFGIEVFKIPSSSMEPTLLGDVLVEGGRLYHSQSSCNFEPYHKVSGTRSGDRIMVTKFFYAAADVQRYDVVVFKFPLNQSRNFIKRVVGMPDEELLLFNGNIYAKKHGQPDFHITRRPLRTQDALWINPAEVRSFFHDEKDFNANWTVEGPRPSFVDDELVCNNIPGGDGMSIRYNLPFEDPQRQRVSDVRIAFDLTPAGAQGEVFAEIQNAYGRFELRLSTSSDGTLNWHATHEKSRQPRKFEPTRTRLEIDRRIHVELGVYDGLAYARVDGALLQLPFIETRKDVETLLPGDTQVRFGGKDGAFRVRNLKVGRDVHYKGSDRGRFAEDKGMTIRPGHYVVMGDNVTSSHDSRGWIEKRIKLMGREEILSYEGQQDFDIPLMAMKEQIQDRYGLPTLPHDVIADKYGRVWALYHSAPDKPIPADVPAGVLESDPALKDADFYEVEENFIVGKALWVWWPPGRWCNLIR